MFTLFFSPIFLVQKMEAKQALENLMRSVYSALGDEIGKNLDDSEKV